MPELKHVTLEQALAFVNALTETTATSPDGDPCGEFGSPAAMTHLAAVLGYGRVLNPGAAWRVTSGKGAEPEIKRFDEFCGYLQAVINALRADKLPRDSTLHTCGTQTIHVAELPDDLAEAFESFKLAIMHHKLAGWAEITESAVSSALVCLLRVITEPMQP